MKILINAISLKKGGPKVLINSFLENIKPNDGNEYYVMAYKDTLKTEIIERKNYDNIIIYESYLGDMNYIKRYFWYQCKLPYFIEKNKFDYMINFTDYGPKRPRCKQVLTLHNPKHVSKEFLKNTRLKRKLAIFLRNIVLSISLKGVDTLVVQTDYMKQRVNERFKFPLEKIKIIPSCPSKVETQNYDKKLEIKLLNFICDEKNVISCVTLYEDYKNLERLMQAIHYLKFNKMFHVKLIITIDAFTVMPKNSQKLLDMIKTLDIEDSVISVGTVSHDCVYQILEKTKTFVYPSYCESFGIPYVEAMRFGLPIVAADLKFAHDVCANSAEYFKYDSYEDMAEAIYKVLNDEGLYNSLMRESKKRNELFKEDKIVEEYLKLLRD